MSDPSIEAINGAIALLRTALKEKNEEEYINHATIHNIVRDNRDLELRPTPFEEKAKPCPFCGHDNITIREEDLGDALILHWGHCLRCKSEGPANPTRKWAIQRWNERSGR